MAVAAVLIDEGVANPAFTPVWRHLPATETAETTYDVQVNAATSCPPITRPAATPVR